MAIPRFSPSLSTRELASATRRLILPPPDAPFVEAFERRFAEVVDRQYAVMVPSARLGFWLLLRALGLEPGDEVVIPALTYFAIPAMAVTAGCRPVLVDVDPATFTLDPASLSRAIGPRTRAVVPTHLFGLPADMDAVLPIAAEHGLLVIEDCAQALGARLSGRPVGSLGDAALFTFGLTKNLSTLRGAMVASDDEPCIHRVRALLAHASPLPLRSLWKDVAIATAMRLATWRPVHTAAVHPAVRLGNALGTDPIDARFGEPVCIEDQPRLADLPRGVQASVGLDQLERLDDLNRARRDNALRLHERLAHVPELSLPRWPIRSEPVFLSYAVRHPRREALARALRHRGIDTTAGFLSDTSTEPAFAPWARPCPGSGEAHRTLLHLPVHPTLSRREQRKVAEEVRLAAHAIDGATG